MDESYIAQFKEFVENKKFDKQCRLEKDDLVLMIRVYDEPCKLENGTEFKGIYIVELLIRDLKDADRWYMPSTTLVSYDDTVKIIKSIMG